MLASLIDSIYIAMFQSAVLPIYWTLRAMDCSIEDVTKTLQEMNYAVNFVP